MKTLVGTIRDFLRSDQGPTATEYAVLLALIIFGSMAAINLHGCKVKYMYTNIERGLPSGS